MAVYVTKLTIGLELLEAVIALPSPESPAAFVLVVDVRHHRICRVRNASCQQIVATLIPMSRAISGALTAETGNLQALAPAPRPGRCSYADFPAIGIKPDSVF